MSDSPPPVRIIGRYALHQEIAAGGMAAVHVGRLLGPAGFSRTVAIKRLHPHFAKDQEFLDMFLDEARLAARIRHPNVVSTLDVVALEGELFIVMDYVQGESLSKLLRASRQASQIVPRPIAVSVFLGVLYGLHAAHEATDERGKPLGVVHRDVSPQNILVDTDGAARVVDFGVAKAVGRLQSTREGQLKGKLAYMSPEQVKGQSVDRRTDVFAASIVLWEMLTGARLFQGESEGATYGKLIDGVIEPPSQHAQDLPEALDAIVLRGLARNLDERYPTALAMAEDLEGVVALPSPREVGKWVRELAGETLAQRASQVAEVEGHSAVNDMLRQSLADASGPHAALAEQTSDDPAPTIPEPPRAEPEDPPTLLRPEVAPSPVLIQEAQSSSQVSSLNIGRTRPPPERIETRSPLKLVLGLIAAGLAFTLMLALVIGFGMRSRTLPTEPAADPVIAATSLPAAEPAEPTAEPTEAVSPPPTQPSAEPTPADAAPSAAPAESSPPKARVIKQATPPAGCNPPYTLDKDGTRIPKLECY